MQDLENRSPFWERLSDGFIPEQTGVDAEALTRRARLLLVVLILCAGNLAFTGVMHVELGNLRFATLMFLAFPIAVAIAASMRLGVSIRLLTSITVFLIWLVSLSVALSTLGRVAGGLFFLVLVPALAVLLVDRRAGLWWVGITGASILVVGWAGGTPLTPPLIEMADGPARNANLRSAGLVMLAVSGLAYFYSALHQRANDALRVSLAKYRQGERRFRAITEHAYDLIAELDREGRFVFASPGFEEVLGWRPRELTGTLLRDRIHSEDVARADEDWEKLFEKGVVRQEPIRCVSASGISRWFESTMRAYELVEGDPRVVMVARDVTERLEREKLMRHQQKLVAGGTMAAGAAHQLNNPLGAILAAAEYANQFKWNPNFGNLAGDSLDAIQEEAKRCGRILRSMLAFARSEPSERWTEDIKAVLRRAVRAIESEEPDAEVEIILSVTHDGARVLMSPIEIEQVVINLLRNAVQARASVIVLGLNVIENATVQITVSDDGTGMSRDVEGGVFDPFYTTRPETGSGLGLTIAKEIVESHSGEIRLMKSDREGSVFRIELPLAQSEVVLLRTRT